MAELKKASCHLLQHGSCHDIHHYPETDRSQPVPRHRQINEILAKKILKDLTK